MIRQRVIYSGRVQGVGFRATARALARNRSVTGWVRNEDNGTVLLEVQGNADVVEAFLNELRREMGRFIKNEASAQVAIVAEEPDFSIRR